MRKRAKLASEQDRSEPALIDWKQKSIPALAAVESWYTAENELNAALRAVAGASGLEPAVIDFTPLVPDEHLFPVDDYRKCVAQIYSQYGRSLLGYGAPQGYLPLREFIADRLQLHGVHVRWEEIMLTSGAQSALSLILQAFTSPGDKVAVESPTYSRAIGLAKLHGVELLPVDMNSEGMDLDRLQQLLACESPALIYTMPNFHNPTGITTSHAHREALLRMAEMHQIPIIEDGFEEEMKYFGKAVLPIKSIDRRGIVLYVGTFSKVLFPGVRVGFRISIGTIKEEQIKAGIRRLSEALLYSNSKFGSLMNTKFRIAAYYNLSSTTPYYCVIMCYTVYSYGRV